MIKFMRNLFSRRGNKNKIKPVISEKWYTEGEKLPPVIFQEPADTMGSVDIDPQLWKKKLRPDIEEIQSVEQTNSDTSDTNGDSGFSFYFPSFDFPSFDNSSDSDNSSNFDFGGGTSDGGGASGDW